MTKHTPGPWNAHKMGSGKWSIYHNGPIAHSAAQSDLPGSHSAERNARLIAAAPELLAALKACIRDDAGDMLNWAAAVKQARAAIARAEGEDR